jgi:hypothetical protein
MSKWNPMNLTLMPTRRPTTKSAEQEKAKMMADLLIMDESVRDPRKTRIYFFLAAAAGLAFWLAVLIAL